MEYKNKLSERTLIFSKQIIRFCSLLPKNNINNILIRQIVRSSTSVGANYLEANDPLGEKDFLHRLRIARKEAKETIYWLDIMLDSNKNFESDIIILKSECEELIKILSSIILKKLKK